MDKKELQIKLNEIKAQIKANSKDAHFAETLIEELITTKSKIGVEPIELNVGKKIDSFSGETFELVKTNRGILYNEFGHYAIFVEPTQRALYETLLDFIEHKDEFYELKGEEKEQFDLHLSAIGYCLSLPKFVFSDPTFTYNTASNVVQFLKSQYEQLMNEPLQEETIEQDREFEEATLAIENIKEEIKKEEKN